MSAAGDALQMLPASVARFRIWTEPTTAAASASAWKSRRIAGVGGDVGHRRPRAERQPAFAVTDAIVKLGDPLEIDDDPRLDRSVAQPDDQVGAAGEQARIGPELGKQGDRGGEAWSVARTRMAA